MHRVSGSKNIIFVQPALPSYRIDFFDRLYENFESKLKVYFSAGQLGALTSSVDRPWAFQVGRIRPLLGGLSWQCGVAGIPLRREDVLVLSGNPRHLSTLVLLARAKLLNIKIIWWGHYWSSTSRRWRQVMRFLPMALVDANLFYTDDEVQSYRNDRFALGKGNLVAALNNGLDDKEINFRRKDYASADRERALLFVGRLTPKANLGLAIRALANLGAKAPSLYIVGSGEEEYSLKSLADSLGVSDAVHFYGASTDEEFISTVANKCRAFLYPGEVGLSLIHAMAYGLPAIVHSQRRSHMPEIAAFDDGVTGLSFSMDNADSLAAVISENIDNFDLLDRLSYNSKLKVANSFTTKSMSVRFCQLVEALDGSK